MKKKLLGIFVCTLLIATAIPVVGTLDEKNMTSTETIIYVPILNFVNISGGLLGISVDLLNSGGGTAYDIEWSMNITEGSFGPFDITFTVERNQSGSTTAFTETIGSVSNKAGSIHSLFLTVNTTKHLIGTTGRFDIVITNIVDRFSGKSIVAIDGTVSSPNYTVGINPTPVTQPIQHIRNL